MTTRTEDATIRVERTTRQKEIEVVDYPEYPDGDLYCDDDGYDEWEDFNKEDKEDEEEFWAEIDREDLEESDYYEDDE